jgi:hypothetical protein
VLEERPVHATPHALPEDASFRNPAEEFRRQKDVVDLL